MQGGGTCPGQAGLLQPVSAAGLSSGPLETALPLPSESHCAGEAVMDSGMVGTAGAPGIRDEGWDYLEAGSGWLGTLVVEPLVTSGLDHLLACKAVAHGPPLPR